MKKTLKTIALAGALIISSTTVFAEMPVFTAIIGNKAFDLEYVNDEKNVGEIRPLILEHSEFTYVKMLNGKWIDNLTGEDVPKELLPKVEYKDKDGNIKIYDAMDGEEVKETPDQGGDNNSGGNNNGGGSSNVDKDKEELDKLKEMFKIKAAHVYLDNGKEIQVRDIEDEYKHVDRYEVDVRDIGDAQIMGVKFELPGIVTKFTAFKPLTNIVAFERAVANSSMTIDCRDADIKEYDNGEPGVGLKTLQEQAVSFSPEGNYVEIRGQLYDEKGNTQRVDVVIRVK